MPSSPELRAGEDDRLRIAVERSERLDAGLWGLLNGLDLIATDRRRLAGGAFMVALDVHASITSLIRAGNIPSGFILLRSIWEAVVRGYWLLSCATEDQLDRFIGDRLNRKTWDMIKDLEVSGSFEQDMLSSIHSHNSARLNAMTHVGGPLIVRCNSEAGVEYNFHADEIVECLGNAASLALLAGIGLAEAAADNALAVRIASLQRQAFP